MTYHSSSSYTQSGNHTGTQASDLTGGQLLVYSILAVLLWWLITFLVLALANWIVLRNQPSYLSNTQLAQLAIVIIVILLFFWILLLLL